MIDILSLDENGSSRDKEMSKEVMVEEGWRWEWLHTEILALIFSRIPPIEMVKCLPLVCKSWMEVMVGPHCWQDIDIQAWCRRVNDSRVVDQVVKKLIPRSICTIQRLSAYNMGELGFFFVANCGICLEVLEIPMSHSINDHMVLMHMKAMPNLRVLDISDCPKITAKSLAVFGNQCKSLVHLKRHIPPPQGHVSSIDDSEAKTIADTMPNLQRIELCFGRFSDSGLSEILTKCKSLTHLDIRGCWNVKLNGDLKEMCEKIECFRVHHCNSHPMDQFRLWWCYRTRRSTDD